MMNLVLGVELAFGPKCCKLKCVCNQLVGTAATVWLDAARISKKLEAKLKALCKRSVL